MYNSIQYFYLYIWASKISVDINETPFLKSQKLVSHMFNNKTSLHPSDNVATIELALVFRKL